MESPISKDSPEAWEGCCPASKRLEGAARGASPFVRLPDLDSRIFCQFPLRSHRKSTFIIIPLATPFTTRFPSSHSTKPPTSPLFGISPEIRPSYHLEKVGLACLDLDSPHNIPLLWLSPRFSLVSPSHYINSLRRPAPAVFRPTRISI